ncbi:MAG: TRAP transporter small permease [Pseudomonadota bacterium]
MFETCDRVMRALARGLALIAGCVLLLLAIMTVVSVTGRQFVVLGLRPVPGDVELVELGIAFAVFASLAWCQLERGHVAVTFASQPLGRSVNRTLVLIGSVLMTVASAVIAWRLTAGMIDKTRFGETSFILEIPVWHGYAAACLGAWMFVLACAWTVLQDIRQRRAPAVDDANADRPADQPW